MHTTNEIDEVYAKLVALESQFDRVQAEVDTYKERDKKWQRHCASIGEWLVEGLRQYEDLELLSAGPHQVSLVREDCDSFNRIPHRIEYTEKYSSLSDGGVFVKAELVGGVNGNLVYECTVTHEGGL